MRIQSDGNFIDFEVQLETNIDLPSYGDGLVGIKVSSNGFTGQNQVWVSREGIKLFSSSLQKLERTRKGEATLTSMSPGELEIRFYSYDSLGHIAIAGRTGYQVTGNPCFEHSVQFGFTIDPEQLILLSKANWLLGNV